MNLDRVLSLRQTSEFAFPLRTEPIPLVFGNYLDPEAIPLDDTNAGFTPAVCIDRLNLVYAINATSAVTDPPQVFFNGVGPQAETTYTWNPAHAYAGHDPLATIQFSLNTVLDGEISVKFGGSVDGTGVPMTNPIRGLMFVLQAYGGWTLNDFDRALCERATVDMETLGYPFYWVFHEERTVRDWLMEILPHYHTDATETGRSQLAMIVDRSLTTLTVTPDYHIPAHEIQDFGNPLTAISTEKQLDDLVNQATLHLRHNWTATQSAATFVGDFVQSQAAYHAAYPEEFTFRGMYTTAHVTQWLNSFFTRHGFDPRVVRFTLRGLKHTPLIPPRLITVEWPPWGWVQRLLKVRRRTTSWAQRSVSLECVDCQRELGTSVEEGPMSLSQRREQISRVYQWIPGTIGDGGYLEDAPGPTKNEAANGDFELGDNGQWKLTGDSGLSPRWSIEAEVSAAYQGRYYARSIAGFPNYSMRTLRRRIDSGEWVMVSGWFRPDLPGTDGQASTFVEFYDVDGLGLGFAVGNGVNPTASYLESLLLAQAPAGSYHFIPGITLGILPTVGAWRADKVTASSGSRVELINKRINDLGGGNLIMNGDFEAGALGWQFGLGWYLDNALPSSGLFHATHSPDPAPNMTTYLITLSRILVTPGHHLHVQASWRTTGAGSDGQVRTGVYWLDASGVVFGGDATLPLTSPVPVFTALPQEFLIPANAVYAQPWGEMYNHYPGGFWVVDDFISWMYP
jgi:hypothetical protein